MKRQARTLLLTKLGLAGSILAVLAAMVAMVMMLQVWSFEDNVIHLIGRTRRPAVQLALAVSILFGFAGFLLSLEGAADLSGKWRRFGWVGFWLGVIGTIGGIALALAYKFYTL